MRCDECRFWKRIELGDEPAADGESGECRINPPKIIGVISIAANRQSSEQAGIPVEIDDFCVNKGRFPRTYNDCWCGKFEAIR